MPGSRIQWASCEFYLAIITNTIYGGCGVGAATPVVARPLQSPQHMPKQSQDEPKNSFCILLIISHRLGNFLVHGYLLQGAKGWPCSFCDIIFHAILADLDSSRKLWSMDIGYRYAPGYGNSMETPKVVREGKKTRFTHIVSKMWILFKQPLLMLYMAFVALL